MVLDTRAWERKTLRVQDELFLDPKNVRLETTSAQVEADIIEDLFDNEGALSLVEAITTLGYLTHEVPIAVKRGRKYFVVEGNRRLAALKAIQNPKIVPNYQARVAAAAKTLGKRRDSLASIEVMIAPSQTLADQLIAALHTSNPRKPWSPARQAAFFQSQIDAGRTYAQLKVRYPTIDVEQFVLRARLVNRFKNAASGDANLSDFVGSRSWRSGFSSLTRIFESREYRDLSGIRLDDDGELETSLTDEQFDATSLVIIRGMADGNINTRTLNTVKSPRFTQLMSEIRKVAALKGQEADPPGSAGAGSAGTKPATSEGGSKSSPGGAPAPKKRVKNKTRFLATGHIAVPDFYPVAVRLHVEELSITDIQRLPNATFLMLRAVLEKSIKAYADAKGVEIGRTRHQNNGRVQLHNCLSWLVEQFEKAGPSDLVQPAKRVQDGKLANYALSRDALNALNHNHHFHVDPDEVLHMWNSIDSLMRELMKP